MWIYVLIFLTHSFLLPLKSLLKPTVDSCLSNICYVGVRCDVPLIFSLDSCFPVCNFRPSKLQYYSLVSSFSCVYCV